MIRYWLWLAGRRKPQVRMTLLRTLRDAQTIYSGTEETYRSCGIAERDIPDLMNKSLDEAEEICRQCQRLGIRILSLRDAEYPEPLKSIFNPPLVLFLRGKLPADTLALAVIGTRKCSEYGLAVSERMSGELAARGCTIVSGLAAGVDAAAHRGALRSGGQTVAVIGSGLDVIYPRENAALYGEIAEKGAILSEYRPGTPPLARNFPERNRIVSGLSQGVIVTEAPQKSGAMITARLAREQGRDLFAVPGSVYGVSGGCHRLIQEGAAKLVTGSQDILRCYEGRFMLSPVYAPPRSVRPERAPKSVDYRDPALGLSEDEIRVAEQLRRLGPQAVDALLEYTGLSPQQVAASLTMLQIGGLITKEGIFYRVLR